MKTVHRTQVWEGKEVKNANHLSWLREVVAAVVKPGLVEVLFSENHCGGESAPFGRKH